MQFLSALLSSMPGAAAQGLIWGVMAIGVYITYRILDIADLTVEGTITFGAAIAATMIYNGMSLTQLPVAGGETDVVGVANVNIDTVLPSKARMANLIRNVSARDGGRGVAFSRAKPHHQRLESRDHRGRSAGKERRAHHGEYRA